MMHIVSNVAPTKAPEKTYRTRNDAVAAAVAEIGPHARNGFEFEATKCDGAWRWKALDEVKPMTPAEIKTSGGKKSILAMALTIEGGTAMAKMNEAGAIAPAMGPVISELKGDDKLDIPGFLRRPKQTEQEKEAVRRKLKAQVGPDRKIKDPPNIKAAVKRAEKRAAAEAKVDGTPAHAKAKAAVKKTKGGGNGSPPKNLASKPRSATAGASKGQSKTAMVGDLLLRKGGCTGADVLAATGWPAVSMPQQAKACGLKLRKEKVQGEPTRYFGSK